MRIPEHPDIDVLMEGYAANLSIDVYTHRIAPNIVSTIEKRLTDQGFGETVVSSSRVDWSGEDLVETWNWLSSYIPEDERDDTPEPIQSLLGKLNGHPRDALELHRTTIHVAVIAHDPDYV